jgi:hypothetical protein
MDHPNELKLVTSRFAQLGQLITQHKALTLSFWVGLMVLSLVLSPLLENSLKRAGMIYEGGEARQTELRLQQELHLSANP